MTGDTNKLMGECECAKLIIRNGVPAKCGKCLQPITQRATPDRLIGCPFCKGNRFSVRENKHPMEGVGWWVWCVMCGACGPVKDFRQQALEAWNTRIDLSCKESANE